MREMRRRGASKACTCLSAGRRRAVMVNTRHERWGHGSNAPSVVQTSLNLGDR